MKKLFALVLALALGACACAQQPDAAPVPETTIEAITFLSFPDAPESFHGMSEDALQPYFDLAQETLRRYITSAYFTQDAGLPPFPLQISPLLEKYTQLRFEKDSLPYSANDSQQYSTGELLSIETEMIESFMGDASMRSWKIIQGKLLCSLCVKVESRYANADLDSGWGMSVQMLIEDPRNPLLVDWFDLDKGSWDRSVREGHYNLPDNADPWAVQQWPVTWNLGDPENWLGNCKLLPPADTL